MGCADELLTEAAVIDSQGELGDDDDEVLWSIESSDGVAVETIQVGDTPPGFTGSTSLDQELPDGVTLTAQVRTKAGLTTAAAFTLAELEEGDVVTADGKLARADFEQAASQSC